MRCGKVNAGQCGNGNLEIAKTICSAPIDAKQCIEFCRNIAVGAVLFRKFIQLAFLLPKGAHNPHSCKIFLQRSGKRALGFVGIGEIFAHFLIVDKGNNA